MLKSIGHHPSALLIGGDNPVTMYFSPLFHIFIVIFIF